MTTSTLPAPVTREFERTMLAPKGERRIHTEWVLTTVQVTPDVTEEIVVRLTTSHYREAKAYRSFISRFKRTHTAGSPFYSEAFGSVMDNMNTLRSVPVARYSAKTLQEAHAAALTVAALGQEIEKAAAEALRTGGPAESPNR